MASELHLKLTAVFRPRERKVKRNLHLLAAFLLLAWVSAAADTLTLSLNQTTYNVIPGGSFVVSGTVSQSDPVLLGDFLASAGAFPCNQFDCNHPGFGFDPAYNAFLNGPDSSALTLYSGPMFDLFMLPSATPGFSGSFFVTFFAFDSNLDPISAETQYFTLNVVSDVPEPSTILLLGTGLAGVLSRVRRGRPC